MATIEFNLDSLLEKMDSQKGKDLALINAIESGLTKDPEHIKRAYDVFLEGRLVDESCMGPQSGEMMAGYLAKRIGDVDQALDFFETDKHPLIAAWFAEENERWARASKSYQASEHYDKAAEMEEHLGNYDQAREFKVKAIDYFIKHFQNNKAINLAKELQDDELVIDIYLRVGNPMKASDYVRKKLRDKPRADKILRDQIDGYLSQDLSEKRVMSNIAYYAIPLVEKLGDDELHLKVLEASDRTRDAGPLYEKFGRYEEAIEVYQKNREPHNVAMALHKMGNEEEANVMYPGLRNALEAQGKFGILVTLAETLNKHEDAALYRPFILSPS